MVLHAIYTINLFLSRFLGCTAGYVPFIYEQECFIRYNTQAAAKRFISDKARIASVLNGFKNDPFYIHLVNLLAKEFSIQMLYKPRKSR